MFGWLFPFRVSTPRYEKRRARPALELLETRDLLSALVEAEVLTCPEDFEDFSDVLTSPIDLRAIDSFPEIGGEDVLAFAVTQVPLADPDLTITDFQAVLEEECIYTLRGRVLGDQVEGLAVQFGGLQSLATAQANVGPDGWFSLTIRLEPGEEGTATAQVTDLTGRESNLALTLVRQA